MPIRSAPTARRSSAGSGGMDVSDDHTAWHLWWEFNKDPYIKLREAIYAENTKGDDSFFMGAGRDGARDSIRPSRATIRDVVLPSLARTLETTRQRDICLHWSFFVRDVLAPFPHINSAAPRPRILQNFLVRIKINNNSSNKLVLQEKIVSPAVKYAKFHGYGQRFSRTIT